MQVNFQPGFSEVGNTTPDNLIAGDTPGIVTRSITLVSGQNLVRGALLGVITSGGKYTLSAAALSNGGQTPAAILAEDVDASAGDKTTLAYIMGCFAEAHVTFGSGHTAASVREGLRGKGIILKTVVPA